MYHLRAKRWYRVRKTEEGESAGKESPCRNPRCYSLNMKTNFPYFVTAMGISGSVVWYRVRKIKICALKKSEKKTLLESPPRGYCSSSKGRQTKSYGQHYRDAVRVSHLRKSIKERL